MFCTFVFILASTVKVINEHHPINVVSHPGIELEPRQPLNALRYRGYLHELFSSAKEIRISCTHRAQGAPMSKAGL